MKNKIINSELDNNINNFFNRYNFIKKKELFNELINYYGNNSKNINDIKNLKKFKNISYKLPLEFEVNLNNSVIKTPEYLYEKLKKNEKKEENIIEENIVTKKKISFKDNESRKFMNGSFNINKLETNTNNSMISSDENLDSSKRDKNSVYSKTLKSINLKKWNKILNKIEYNKKIQFKEIYKKKILQEQSKLKKIYKNNVDNLINEKFSILLSDIKFKKNRNVHKKLKNIKFELNKSVSPGIMVRNNTKKFKKSSNKVKIKNITNKQIDYLTLKHENLKKIIHEEIGIKNEFKSNLHSNQICKIIKYIKDEKIPSINENLKMKFNILNKNK